MQALLADLQGDTKWAAGRTVRTIFIGGGTPSLLSPEAVSGLLKGVRGLVRVADDAEVTLEANPGTLDEARLYGLRAAGVNRLSVGVQSFDDVLLQRIGRIHGRQEALASLEAARRAGFDNLNLDLMFGLPGQTREQAASDVGTAISLAPSHISYYQLTIEPNTYFSRYPPAVPQDDAVWIMESQGREALHAAGYRQYEVSAHARPGYRCRHNLNYWEFGDYLGIGAGAHGKHTGSFGIMRVWKQKHPTTYLRDARSDERLGGRSVLRRGEAALEFMMNALRLSDGFPRSLFEARTGQSLEVVAGALQQAEELGLLEQVGDWLRPTDFGWRHLDGLVALFVPD